MWHFRSRCHSKARLGGKTVVITGANSGIGKETTRDLYWRGARVILACRNIERGNEAVEDIKKTPPSKPQSQGGPGELAVYKLDLASLGSVRECAKKLATTEPQIHLLINNAGVMMCPHEKTEDGYELQLQTNHLDGKIHFDDLNLEKHYTPLKSYEQSKLANILFTKELDRKLEESRMEGITTYTLHPGCIPTEVTRHWNDTMFPGSRKVVDLFKPFAKTPELGAQTTIHCAVDEAAGSETGHYYTECKISAPASRAENKEDAGRMWTENLKMVGLPAEENLAELLNAIETEILPSL